MTECCPSPSPSPAGYSCNRRGSVSCQPRTQFSRWQWMIWKRYTQTQNGSRAAMAGRRERAVADSVGWAVFSVMVVYGSFNSLPFLPTPLPGHLKTHHAGRLPSRSSYTEPSSVWRNYEPPRCQFEQLMITPPTHLSPLAAPRNAC